MPIHHFEQYKITGPTGTVFLSRTNLVTGATKETPVIWNAQHDALGNWTIVITKDSDADREAKYLQSLTGVSFSQLRLFLQTYV